MKLSTAFVYMKHKCILCLDLGPIPKISHYIFQTLKYLKIPYTCLLLVPSIRDTQSAIHNFIVTETYIQKEVRQMQKLTLYIKGLEK